MIIQTLSRQFWQSDTSQCLRLECVSSVTCRSTTFLILLLLSLALLLFLLSFVSAARNIHKIYRHSGKRCTLINCRLINIFYFTSFSIKQNMLLKSWITIYHKIYCCSYILPRTSFPCIVTCDSCILRQRNKQEVLLNDAVENWDTVGKSRTSNNFRLRFRKRCLLLL